MGLVQQESNLHYNRYERCVLPLNYGKIENILREHNLMVKVSICGVENVGSNPSARLATLNPLRSTFDLRLPLYKPPQNR